MNFTGQARIPTYEITVTERAKNIDGIRLAVAARKTEKNKPGSGRDLLVKYVPDLIPEHVAQILSRQVFLVGVDVFFVIPR